LKKEVLATGTKGLKFECNSLLCAKLCRSCNKYLGKQSLSFRNLNTLFWHCIWLFHCKI